MMEFETISIEKGADKYTLPYLQLEGAKPGPRIFVTAGMHGNEINGIWLAKRFCRWLVEDIGLERLSGTVDVFPLLNPTGFAQRLRVVSFDGRDLNRQFGYEAMEGEPISRYVARYLVEEYFSKCSMGVDLHDSGSTAVFLPHCRIHISDEEDCVSCSRNMARIFGTDYILERNGSKHMMAVHLNDRHNTPVITVEIGGDHTVDSALLEIGLRGLSNVLKANGMVDGSMDLPGKQYVASKRFTIRTEKAVFVEFYKNLGDSVEQGEKIGLTYDPVTCEEQDLLAPNSGVIFARWHSNHARSGNKIYSILDTDLGDGDSVIELENYVVNSVVT